MLAQEISIPVYFSKYNGELSDIIDDISADAKDARGGQPRESALSELVNSVSANGYQILVSGATHLPNKQSKLPIIHGELAPVRNTKNADANTELNYKLPLIIVAAHLDTFGLINVGLHLMRLARTWLFTDVWFSFQRTKRTMSTWRCFSR